MSESARLGCAESPGHDVPALRAFRRWVEAARTLEERAPATRSTAAPVGRGQYGLVVISNRTPALVRGRAREVGGLVSALEPALRDENAVWLGWSGQEQAHGASVIVDGGMVVDPGAPLVRARFDLPVSVRQRFYTGFCNSVLWPLLHSFPGRVRGSDGDWAAYVRANERYARLASELARRDATIWVHDYHLLLVARALRALGHRGRIGLFLHTPFPTREIFETIPWARELADGMMHFDLLGFQTQQAAANFRAAAGGAVSDGRTLRLGDRAVEVDVFPATIDAAGFRAELDESPEIAGLRRALGDRKVLLGVDRLDYSKGIPERLIAYERMLEQFPHWQRRVVLVQISVPSRADIPDYAELRRQVEGIVGRINGRFGDIDWVPVRYLYRSYDPDVLAQLYRLADVALVTPLRDGMNLVAKEFVAAQNPACPGVLVLSQYAGAAESLRAALITDPLHPDGLAITIDRALQMTHTERAERHAMLSAALEHEGDARAWARRFLGRLDHARRRRG